jgi:hypothetical protein
MDLEPSSKDLSDGAGALMTARTPGRGRGGRRSEACAHAANGSDMTIRLGQSQTAEATDGNHHFNRDQERAWISA